MRGSQSEAQQRLRPQEPRCAGLCHRKAVEVSWRTTDLKGADVDKHVDGSFKIGKKVEVELWERE